ncbi:MAG: AAA family ATPase, partial [Ignavibacteriae bacterium]|nr:AAA family ATPase [Ignavibacteriota bacterium]
MEKLYIKRKLDGELLNWIDDPLRKPLILRGARQVGKSSAVRHLSGKFKYFLEVNFEEHKQAHSIFSGNLSPREICDNLSLMFNIPVIPGETLLFFDEIQSCIPAISSVRFFYEKYNELHLITAGSLLDFALSELPSFGVGRVRSMFIYPFSFDEFLFACGEELLFEAKKNSSLEKPLQEPIHEKLLTYLKKFLIMGGMPEVVAGFVRSKSIISSRQILDDLITSLKVDFAKYKKRVPALRITEVFESVTNQMGNKFVFSKAATEANHKQVKEAINLLIMAGLVIPVTHSSSNGIPLGAESDQKKRKMLVFDTGVFQKLLGLDISSYLLENDFNFVNKGAIAELFVGLEIIKSLPCYRQQELYYWQRETASSNAEVDYVFQSNHSIIPIEVKKKKKGSMQ